MLFRTASVLAIAALAMACGKENDDKSKAPPPPGGGEAKVTKKDPPKKPDGDKDKKPAKPAGDEFATYAALDVGADYKSWDKLNKTPVKSKTHGGRFVDTYVNKVGVEAYKKDDAEIPVGTIIVKSSFEVDDNDKATDVAGPLFIMERKAGKDGKGEWWYGLHWEKVPAQWQDAMGGSQAYWRTPSDKVGYCSDCHDNYDRELGGIPKSAQAY